MRCEFNDGFKVDYTGSLRIKKSDDVNVFLYAADIPANIKGELYEADLHNSCGELRHIAQEVTDILGNNIPK